MEICEETREAILRGFTPNTVTSGDLSLHNLYSLEYFPAYLHKIGPLVNLSQWFKNIFEVGWETIETVPTLAFRSNLKPSHLKRCKLLQLGNMGELVELIVTITPESNSNINIFVELKPGSNQLYLPVNLQLILIDEF